MLGKASEIFPIHKNRNTPKRPHEILNYLSPTKKPKNGNDKAKATYSEVTKIMQKDSSGDKLTGEKWVDVAKKKKPIEKAIILKKKKKERRMRIS